MVTGTNVAPRSIGRAASGSYGRDDANDYSSSPSGRQEVPVTAVTALRTQSLVREFRGFRAVDGVDLAVA